MTLTLTSVLPDQSEAVGTLVYEAFREIAERHNFEPQFSSPELAHLVMRLLAQTEGWESYLIVEDGKPLACNFGDERDEVVGIGPVAVAVDQQGRGLGRRVMEALIEQSEERGFRSLRLTTAAYNMQSFSLYHKLGFDAKALLANLRGRPPADATPSAPVRDYTPADLDGCDALHHDVHGFSRRHDIEFFANFAPPPVVERDGQVAGYCTRFPGEDAFIMHGVARDEQTLRDLIIGTARQEPGELHLLLPVSQAETLRWSMAHGFRLAQLDSYMVRGEYQQPQGAWIPSGFY